MRAELDSQPLHTARCCAASRALRPPRTRRCGNCLDDDPTLPAAWAGGCLSLSPRDDGVGGITAAVHTQLGGFSTCIPQASHQLERWHRFLRSDQNWFGGPSSAEALLPRRTVECTASMNATTALRATVQPAAAAARYRLAHSRRAASTLVAATAEPSAASLALVDRCKSLTGAAARVQVTRFACVESWLTDTSLSPFDPRSGAGQVRR